MKNLHIPEFELVEEGSDDLGIKVDLLEQQAGYDPMKPHRHNGYEIFLFEEGGGWHMVDFEELNIEASQVHVLCPGQVHYMDRAPESKGRVLKFTSDFLLNRSFKEAQHRFLRDLESPCFTLKQQDFDQLMEFVKAIALELGQTQAHHNEMVMNYLNLFLISCKRFQVPNKKPGKDATRQLLSGFNQLLEDQFSQEHSVSFYAAQLSVSQDKLTTTTKAVLGKTASEVIADRLLLETKRWLLHSEESVKEITFKLGFQDQAYFNRWCKKLTGNTPGELRSLLRDKYNN